MDLVVAMAPCVDEVTMTKTYELIKPYLEVRIMDHIWIIYFLLSYPVEVTLPVNFTGRHPTQYTLLMVCLCVCVCVCVWFQTKEAGMQKKAYRVLEELCGGERPECQSFIMANMETLKQVLLDTLKNASSPAKRVRPPPPPPSTQAWSSRKVYI